MKCAIYCRVSTEEQSPETQLKDIYTIAPADAEVISEQQSAWKDHIKERPKFKDLQERIMRKEINALYVWDLDRIYRNQVKTVGFMNMCQAVGCSVYSFRQTWLNQIDRMEFPKGMEWLKEQLKRNSLEMFAWIAEDESNKRSDRVRKAVVRTEHGTESYKGRRWGRPVKGVDVAAILARRNEGKSIRALAAEFKVSRDKIHRVIKSKADSFINKEAQKMDANNG